MIQLNINVIYFCVILTQLLRISHQVQGNLSTLRLLHVFSRHADRTPLRTYPKEVYTNEDFYPYEMGELTNEGKNRAYNLGFALRQQYGKFLGERYSPSIVKAISSPFSRCLESILLTLTALFPPVGAQIWRHGSEWQPISYDYNSIRDKIFLVYKHCPNFRIYQNRRLNTQEYINAFKEYEDVIAYLRHHTGDYKEKYIFAYSIYSTLSSEMQLGLPLPAWAKEIFPHPLKEIAETEIDEMYKGENNFLGAAHFMTKLVNDTILMTIDAETVKDRKLYIYGGHDMNVAAILSWLDIYEPHIPDYCAYIAFEIHDINNIPHIKILYQGDYSGVPHEMSLPTCEVMCPFQDFLRMYKHKIHGTSMCGD